MNPTTRANNPTFRALSCISRTSHPTPSAPKYRTCLSYSAVPIRDLYHYCQLRILVPSTYQLLVAVTQYPPSPLRPVPFRPRATPVSLSTLLFAGLLISGSYRLSLGAIVCPISELPSCLCPPPIAILTYRIHSCD